MKNIPCRLCGALLPTDAAISFQGLPQGAQQLPTQEGLLTDHGVDIQVRQCPMCSLVQVDGSQIVYREGITSATCTSQSIIEHRQKQAEEFVKRFNLENRKVLEVGCGDGHFMELLASAGAQVSGIEPSTKATAAAAARHLNIMQGYITRNGTLAGQPYDAFVTIHVLEHVPDLADFLVGIWMVLSDDAVGFIEVPSLEQILERSRFYDFMPDHLSYFSQETLRLACEKNGFSVIETGRNWNGEHNFAIVRKRNVGALQGLVAKKDEITSHFQRFLRDQGAANKRVAVWGASYHAIALLSQVDHQGISFVVDSAEYKQGRYMPVSHIPIISPEQFRRESIDIVLVLAPRFYEEILQSLLNDQRFTGSIALMNGEKIEIIRK